MPKTQVGFVKIGGATVGTDGGNSMFHNILSGGTHFPLLGSTEANAKSRLPKAYRLNRLVVRTGGAQPADNALTMVLRRNGTDTGLKVTVPASSPAGAYADSSASVDVTTGDDVNWEARKSGGATSAPINGISFLMEPLQ